MKRYSFSLGALLRFVACFAAVLLLSSSVSAQVELSVQLGFEGKLTPGRYAPIRIEVRNYHDIDAGRLHIVQPVGNEWRGEATMQQELGFAIQSSGVYESVIPIYDPVNPIIVELLSSADTVLASETIDLRGAMSLTPYPVLDKKIARFDERAAVIDMDLLPLQWWAFDGVDSLWVASPLPREAWAAISRWVLAGGSLVLLTGTDFYRMDSPTLRELLPISSPTVALSDFGTNHLTGTLTDGTISMLSDEGFPLLIQASYGAGHVSLVTIQARSLPVEILKNIGERIAPSRLISLRNSTERILGEQTVSTLKWIFVLAMVVLLFLVICGCSVIGRRDSRLGWSILLVSIIGLSVSSGFVSNPATYDTDLYTVNTRLYLEAHFGLYTRYSSLYSETSHPYIQRLNEEIIPVQFLPRTLIGTDSYDFSTFPSHSQLTILSGQMRHWHAYGAASSLFDVRLVLGSLVRVSNHFPLDFDAGWIVVDGMVHSIGEVYQGIHDYSFVPESAARLAAFVSSAYTSEMMAKLLLIRELKQSFPLTKGVWLIAVADAEHVVSDDIMQKVRDITLAVVRGVEVDREI